MKSASRLCLIALLALVAQAACAKKTPAPPPAPPAAADAVVTPPPPPATPPPPPAPVAAALSEDDLFARKSLAELNAERPLGTVYFDLDESSLRDEARSVLQRNAEWLRRWPSTRINIEGHCDERGSAEYNLALGERRASAVKGYLESLGVAPERLVVVSKGKEAPICTVSEDSCWQQNRRGAPFIVAK
ncbi:MAG: peptidoglycan-associated lipoprotein Pal [Vicinamibacterales bacterium]